VRTRPSATLELQSARAAFDRLGAVLDRREADKALAAGGTAAGPAASERRQTTKTFAFTDIVDSTRLGELLGDEAWERLIRWHDETLRSLVAAHGGEEVKSIGDGFFIAFDDPAAAIDCAIAIQRRLAEQRQTQGFAPAVRIGIHRGRASRAGADYIGQGVNQAARIGAIAAGGEILVSVPTLQATPRTFTETERRSVELRGISRPVQVASVAW
jgi:class 3 adenylate cyclase